MPDPVAAAAAPLTAPSAPPPRHHSTFRELLSELNPLQYLPVIGTLYRAITGDCIPAATQEAGSLVVSGLTGGPIGVAINLGALLVEKITGLDPEKIATHALASVGIGGGRGATIGPPAHASQAVATPAQPTPPSPAIQHGAWSAGQLAAYGVTTSDVLNGLELDRVRTHSTFA